MNKEDLNRKGVSLFERGLYEEALIEFKKSLKKDSRNVTALTYLGRILSMLGDLETALKFLNKAVKIEPENADVLSEQASVLAHMQEYDMALRSFEKALKIEPNNTNALNGQGLLLAAFRDMSRALSYYAKAIELNEHPTFWYNKALSHTQLGQQQDALICAEKALEMAPDFPDAWYLKGRLLYDMREYSNCLVCFNEAIKLEPEDSLFWYCKGMALGELKDFPKALDSYNQAINLDSDNVSAWRDKGIILATIGHYEEAIECSNQVMRLAPDDIDGVSLKAKCLFHLQRSEEAILLLDKTIENQPTNAEIQIRKGNILYEFKKLEEALHCFESAIRIDEDNSNAWSGAGDTLFSLGKYQRAVECYKRVMQVDPQNERSRLYMCNALYKLEKLPEAIECFKKYLELVPDDSNVWFGKGNASYRLGNYEEALDSYEKAISLEPEISTTWTMKGNSLVNLQRSDEAIKSFDKAISLDPKSNLALISKAQLLCGLGKQQDAIKHFDMAIENDQNDSDAWFSKGMCLGNLQKHRADDGMEVDSIYFHLMLPDRPKDKIIEDSSIYEDALKCFDQALEIDPNDARKWLKKSVLLIRLNRYNAAIECIDQAIQKDKNYEFDIEVLRTKVPLLALVNRHDEAIECVNTIMKISPSPTISIDLDNVGNTMVKSAKYKEAIIYFDKSLEIDPDNTWTLLSKGDALSLLTKNTDALKYYNKAAELDPSYKDAWIGKGEILNNLQRYDEAIKSFDKAISLDSTNNQALTGKGKSLYKLGREAEAVKIFEKAKETMTVEGEHLDNGGQPNKIQVQEQELEDMYKNASKYLDSGDISTARKLVQLGIDTSRSKPDQTWAATFLHLLGKSYMAEKRAYEAYKSFTEALKICPKDSVLWNSINVGIGNLFQYHWGRLRDASIYYQRADNISYQKNDLFGYLSLQLSLADFAASQDKFQRALYIVKEKVIPASLKKLNADENNISDQVDRPPVSSFSILCEEALIRYARYSFGLFLRNGFKEDYNNAMKAVQEAGTYANESFFRTYKLLLELGRFKMGAAEWFEKVKEWIEKLGLKTTNEMDSLKLKVIREQYQSAVSTLEDSLLFAESLRNKSLLGEVYTNLGICYNLMNDGSKAESLLKKALELMDEAIVSELVSEVRVTSEFFQLRYLVLCELCLLMVNKSELLNAAGYIELGKAREMFRQVGSKISHLSDKAAYIVDSINSLNKELRLVSAKRDQALREVERIQHEQQKLPLTPDQLRQSHPTLIQELNKLDSQYGTIFMNRRELEDQLWKQYANPGVSMPKNPKQVIERFIELSNKLMNSNPGIKRWAVIEFAYLKRIEKLALFFLDYKGVLSFYDVNLRYHDWKITLPNLINSFRYLMQVKKFNDAEKIVLSMASRIRNNLIPNQIFQKLRDLDIKQLMVVPDGILHSMPLELIGDKEDSLLNERWGIKYNLTRGFSINHFCSQLQTHSVNPTKDGLIVANPTDLAVKARDVDPLLQTNNLWIATLPHAEEEARCIETVLRNNQATVTVLVREQASEQAFISNANKSAHSMIHFAGHAKFDTDDPNQSYLLLNNGNNKIEKLYANEIASKIRLKGHPLVTLSSCESANSEVKIGNEAYGLVRAFIMAGASDMLLSGWIVFDDSACEFMELFYSKLYDGFNMADSIAHARDETRKRAEAGEYKVAVSALHWAPYQLWGLPFQRIKI